MVNIKLENQFELIEKFNEHRKIIAPCYKGAKNKLSDFNHENISII